MIWKILSATGALFIIVIAFLAWAPGANAVGSQVNSQYGTLSRNGLSVGTFITQNYTLYGASIVIAIFFVVVYLIVGANTPDEGQEQVTPYYGD